MYKKNSETHVIENNERVVLINLANKNWLRTSKKYYEIIDESVSKSGNIDKMLQCFQDSGMQVQRNNLELLFEELKGIAFYIKVCEVEQNSKLDVVSLMITNRCNLKCLHCCTNAEVGNQDIINTHSMKEILQKISALNPKSLLITGGEPFIRDDIAEILKFTRRTYKGNIILNTNGTILDKDIKTIAECIDVLDLSLDGFDERTCSAIRGKGVFERVKRTIAEFQSNGFRNISLSQILTKDNVFYKKEFQELCNSLGVQAIFRPVFPTGRGWKNREELCVPIEEIVSEAKPHHCKPGIKELSIFFNGDVYPCANLTGEEYLLGNILNDEEILEKIISEKFRFNKMFTFMDSRRSINSLYCKECKVNIFCWECIARFQSIKSDPKLLDEYCKYKKEKLHEKIWGI